MKLTQKELQLRQWALEVSLKYGQILFPQRYAKRPSEIVSNAHRIISLVTEGWNNPIIDPPSIDSSECPRNFP
jgi:hypothetical protein